MFGSPPRVVTVEEAEAPHAYEVKTWTRAGEEEGTVTDAPPEAFVQRVEHPGGDVYVVPILEALRAWLKKGREETVSGSAHNDDGSTEERGAR